MEGVIPYSAHESMRFSVALCAMKLTAQFDLQPLNTFHIHEHCSLFGTISSEVELIEFLGSAEGKQKPLYLLGGGSNILLTQAIDGLVLHNQLQGKRIVEENEDFVKVEFSSGELWHDCVMWCVDRNWGGMENMALIPGTIGAAPIQNIGAYGAELKDVFFSLQALHLQTLETKTFTAEACRFGYRDSVFKQEEKGRWFILSVTLILQKKPQLQVGYGDIRKVIEDDFHGEKSIRTIAEAVIRIRQSKLPDPAEIGNAGSFFKNPVISVMQAANLLEQFPEMPQYSVESGIKIPAAWLIEQCGWKGFREGDYGVHTRQALVLVNYSQASGSDLLHLSARIITSVQQRFNIQLEREVNIW